MWCKVTTAKLKLKNKFFISIGACSFGDSDPNRGTDLRSKSAHPPQTLSYSRLFYWPVAA